MENVTQQNLLAMCRELELNRGGFYAWLKQAHSKRTRESIESDTFGSITT